MFVPESVNKPIYNGKVSIMHFSGLIQPSSFATERDRGLAEILRLVHSWEAVLKCLQAPLHDHSSLV